MDNKKLFRYQTIPLTIANGTVVNTLTEANVTLDREFNVITGIEVTQVTSDATLLNQILVGGKTSRKVWIDQIPLNNWLADTGVSPNDKFFDVLIPFGSGDNFYFQAVNLAVPGANNAVLYMTLRLEANMEVMPRQ